MAREVVMNWMEEREARVWQIRELIHRAERCLDKFEGSPLIPDEVLTLAKSLECATGEVAKLVNSYLSECVERSKN
jgi:hypothetical protein